jgi:hypothetical protein
MSACGFLFQNLPRDPDQVTPTSARPGLVGLPAPRAQGAATALSGGEHTGGQDQVFLVEIDSLAAGSEVGQASFRWRRAASPGWEASGRPTGTVFQDLADGVRIKWLSGAGADFALGDAWTILAMRSQGGAMLLDRDRDTEWVSLGCAHEHLTIDLGQPQAAPALALLDHNFTSAAEIWLLADDGPDWEHPAQARALTPTSPHLVCLTDWSARHWRLTIADPDNPEGCLRASLLHLGGCFSPSRTFRAGYQRSLVAGRSTTVTDAGKLGGSARGLAQSWQIGFRGLTDADLAGFEALFAACHEPASGLLNPLIFIPFLEKPWQCLYCLPATTLSPVQRHLDSHELALQLEEVIKSHV